MKILVIVPAYNEAAIIASTIDDIRNKAHGVDILVVNDGSQDATEQKLISCGADHLQHCTNLGIGGAVQSGYKYACLHGYDYTVQIDGDGQHDPAFILPMIEWMENEKIDVGIGSRFLDGNGFQSSRMRRIGIRFLTWLIRMVCGANVKDVTSGYRVVNRRFSSYFAAEYSDDYPESDSIPAVVLHGGKVAEYPVKMRERTTGHSSIGALRSLYYIVKVSISILLCRQIYSSAVPAEAGQDQ